MPLPDQDARVNPYAAPRAFAALPRRPPESGARRFWSALSSMQLLCVVAAIVAAFVDIETIVLSGPLLSLTGIGLVLTAALGRGGGSQRVAVMALGLSTPAISLFCLALIVALDWSPREAQAPVSTIALLYGLLAGAVWMCVVFCHFRQGGKVPDSAAGRAPTFRSPPGRT